MSPNIFNFFTTFLKYLCHLFLTAQPRGSWSSVCTAKLRIIMCKWNPLFYSWQIIFIYCVCVCVMEICINHYIISICFIFIMPVITRMDVSLQILIYFCSVREQCIEIYVLVCSFPFFFKPLFFSCYAFFSYLFSTVYC